MIKKISLLTALSVTAFSGWAQDATPDTLVVTANRFQQPVNTVLAPTDIVTREDIERWQSRTVLDVMRRLPGVDVAQNGGMGQSSSLFVRGTEAKHVLVLVDGIPVARPGISNNSDIDQIPVSLVQRIEYIRGPRSAIYGSGAIGGVVNIITMTGEERSQINAGVGSKGYQQYDGTYRQRFGDTVVTAAGAYQTTKGFDVQPRSGYSGDSDRDGYRNKLFWGALSTNLTINSMVTSEATAMPVMLIMTRGTGVMTAETTSTRITPSRGIRGCVSIPVSTRRNWSPTTSVLRTTTTAA